MKLTSYMVDGSAEWGVIRDNEILRVSQHAKLSTGSLKHFLREHSVTDIASLADGAATIEVASVEFLPPLPDAEKIICVGLNYRDHVEEMGRTLPEKPVIFIRFADSLVGHNQHLIAPAVSNEFDYEGELAVVIGSTLRDATAEEAEAGILGYSVFNDGTIRDFQRHTHQFAPGKNFPSSGSMGPSIVTADEISNIAASSITTSVDGVIVQQSTLEQLVFDIPSLISYISSWTPLRPGDIIATGTPGGVGDSFTPPLWLAAGSTVAVTVDGVGTLTNPVSAQSSP
jgi:2-keto-4-pentenoate hydratase/2-oxohepta-3-ene-1,7-dioic acid hydratase in catechol pathway